MDKHRRLAERAMSEGDPVRAAAHWQVVLLRAPEDGAAACELAHARLAAARASAEAYEAGVVAQRKAETDAAVRAFLRTLYFAPEHAEAARVSREIEMRRMTRILAANSARARREGPDAATRAAAGNGSRWSEAAAAYDLEQRLEIFRAGDTVGGLRELRRYVEANPQ